MALGGALLELGATSAMDLSDGLLGDLPKILAASGVAARLDEGAFRSPRRCGRLFPEAWVDLALRGGEDYELLFTAPRRAWDAIEGAAQTAGGTVTAIGEAFPGGTRASTIALSVAMADGVRFPSERMTTSAGDDGLGAADSGASHVGRERAKMPERSMASAMTGNRSVFSISPVNCTAPGPVEVIGTGVPV